MHNNIFNYCYFFRDKKQKYIDLLAGKIEYFVKLGNKLQDNSKYIHKFEKIINSVQEYIYNVEYKNGVVVSTYHNTTME